MIFVSSSSNGTLVLVAECASARFWSRRSKIVLRAALLVPFDDSECTSSCFKGEVKDESVSMEGGSERSVSSRDDCLDADRWSLFTWRLYEKDRWV
jgi:hypothetical protein